MPNNELSIFSDEHFMKLALQEAEQAYEKQEIPIGAVVVSRNRVIARAHNLTEQLNDVTAHAEMQAITAAANFIGGKYLNQCTLYVTIEPCPMCAGALYWSHIGRIVFGAPDEKRGYRTVNVSMLHPRTEVTGGVMAGECRALLQKFFQERRAL